MQDRVLLINPPVESWGKMKSIRHSSPPLGLLSVAAYLEKKRFSVEVLDYSLEQIDEDRLLHVISNIKIVGITATTNNIGSALEIAEKIKNINRNIFIVFGGAHSSVLPKELLGKDFVDFVVIGEGEYVFFMLCRALTEGGKFEDIEGIAYKKNQEVIINQRSRYIEELDDLPFPARHLVPFNRYKATPINYKNWPSTPVITSRGCPFNCTFCSNPVHGRKLRLRGAENVIEELILLKREFGIRDVVFWDDTFTVDNKRIKHLCDLLIKKNLRLTWSCATRVDTIDLKLLKRMKDAGCWQVSFGVESGVSRLRKKIRKNITNQQIMAAFGYCRKVGIQTRAFFILGLPTETEEETEKTVEFTKELNPDFAQFTLATPYPGSDLFQEAVSEGWVPPDWDKFQTYPEDKPVYVPENRTSGSLTEAQSKAFKSFYLRPRYLASRLLKIKSFPDFIKNAKVAVNLMKF